MAGRVDPATTNRLFLDLLVTATGYEQSQVGVRSLLSHVRSHEAFADNNRVFSPQKLELRKVHSVLKEFHTTAPESWTKKMPESKEHQKWKKALAEFIAQHQLDAPIVITNQSTPRQSIKFQPAATKQQSSMTAPRQAPKEEPKTGMKRQREEQRGVFGPDSAKARQDISNRKFRKEVEKNKGL